MSDMNANARLYVQKLTYRRRTAPALFLAQPWFIQAPHPVYIPRHGCAIEPLICGEEVFKSISDDLHAARRTVDIITWGFDPGMVLVRGATAEQGIRYGDVLEAIATRDKHPVFVRLLVWHDDAAAQQKMNNTAGYYGRLMPTIGSTETGFYSDAHQEYNAAWFDKVCANNIPNIHLHVREIDSVHMLAALLDETLPAGLAGSPNGLMAALYPTHHQKMVLIDYENPQGAIGYVMGHNSITDFWDTRDHLFNDPRRERIYRHSESETRRLAQGKFPPSSNIAFAYLYTERGKKDYAAMVQTYMENNSHVAKPYQDVSCRLKGSILYDLNHNFCQAWKESEPPNSFFVDAFRMPLSPLRGLSAPARLAAKIIHKIKDEDFIGRRAAIRFEDFHFPGQHSVQLLRTQPQHKEKGVKECYANLTRQMRHYMFIQNQYIQYADWARHLVECVGRLRTAGYRMPIYVFMLTSTPEREGMDLPTYEATSELGLSEQMKVEHARAVERARLEKGPPPISPDQLRKQGINVVMGSLWTCAKTGGKLRPSDYEEIYIHAKVAVVDDAAFTIGSANLNLRSMAMDSELNILSQSKEVGSRLRMDLFEQCTGEPGPGLFGDMGDTFQNWQDVAKENAKKMTTGNELNSQILPFFVDRKPGSPLV